MISTGSGLAQQTASFADSVRLAYHIPELSYAVVSIDSILEMKALGEKKIHTGRVADLNDLYRIGSNTKAITGFMAAMLVKEGKIAWDSRFFDLYPDLKPYSLPAYYDMSLMDLLTFRTVLPKYTYTDKTPDIDQFTGNEGARYQFMKWFLNQKPAKADKNGMVFSNVGYVAAGLMLEKATGKTYKELVTEMGNKMHISFHFGQPNNMDTLQTWGHDGLLKPEPPGENRKLEWLQAAGNITMSLPEYARFLQIQLQGLAGRSALLVAKNFEFLFSCRPIFSVGWFILSDENKNVYMHNTGNPGTFLTNVYVFKHQQIAIIVFANAQTRESEEGEDQLFERLRKTYIH